MNIDFPAFPTKNVDGDLQFIRDKAHDPFDLVPLEIWLNIFDMLKFDLDKLALVSRQWKVIVDDKPFREMIFPEKAFGAKDWVHYYGVNLMSSCLVPNIPRCAYRDLENEGGMLTFIPREVCVSATDNQIIPINVFTINDLAKSPKAGHITGYHSENYIKSCRECDPFHAKCFLELEMPERSYWVWIKGDAVGTDLGQLDEQIKLLFVKEKRGARCAGIRETVISLMTRVTKTGEKFFFRSATDDKQGMRTDYNWTLFFTKDGLQSDEGCDFKNCINYGPAPARSFFCLEEPESTKSATQKVDSTTNQGTQCKKRPLGDI